VLLRRFDRNINPGDSCLYRLAKIRYGVALVEGVGGYLRFDIADARIQVAPGQTYAIQIHQRQSLLCRRRIALFDLRQLYGKNTKDDVLRMLIY
jgi:hypothetical protein